MKTGTAIDLMLIKENPRSRPLYIRLPLPGLAGVLVALIVFVGWLGFTVTRTWDQRELRNAITDQTALITDINGLNPAVKQARQVLRQARESHDLAATVFGLSVVDSPARSGGTGKTATPHELGSIIEQIDQDMAFAINSLKQTTVAINRELIRHTPSAAPVNGRITSRFGMRRHPIFGKLLFHNGVDISGVKGTAIKATAAGWIFSCGYSTRSGRFLCIDHGYGYTSTYTHLDRICVRKGQKISRGQTIAALGNTGLATGPHLHYEIRWNGRPIDPEPFLADQTARIDSPHTKPGVLYFKSQCLQAARQKRDSTFIWPWSSG